MLRAVAVRSARGGRALGRAMRAVLAAVVLASRPNILVVLSDDVGYGDVGCARDRGPIARDSWHTVWQIA